MTGVQTTGPLGSTDKNCCVDTTKLFNELNEEDSELRPLWTDQSIQDWVKTLNVERGLYKPTFVL